MSGYPIFTKTLVVVVPACTVVPVAGLVFGILAALILVMVVTA